MDFVDTPFLPVLLGTDICAYGVARSFHQAYGLRSLALGRSKLDATGDSTIVDVVTYPDFDKDEVFREQIILRGKELSKKNIPLLLIPCSDNYVSLVTRNLEAIKEYFLINTIDENMRLRLENKQAFYKSCAETGLPYPATVVVNSSNYKSVELPFPFPVAVKPDDSIAYLGLKFAGKKKAYVADSAEELTEILANIYQADYSGDMIIQDFIPGGTEAMYVLNAYVDKKGQVRASCTARCVLDECLPLFVGNYNVLISGDFPAVDAQCKSYLEQIGYRGFANFDLKYDHRDGKFKVFEINLRHGRSSFYTTAAGCNLVTWMVDDLVKGESSAYYRHTKEHLWLNVSKYVARKYAPEELKAQVKRLIAEKKYSYTLAYNKDRLFKKRLALARRKLSTSIYYRKFCK